MRTTNIIPIIILAGGIQTLYPQETARERIEQRRQTKAVQSTSIPSLHKGGVTHPNEDIGNARWSRVIYRYLDLTKEANAPLSYPETPTEGRMNLFSMIFRLLQDDAIQAYEYLDGRELFTNEYLINFQEFLDRFDIYYETDNGSIVINDADIPGHEVQGYFVKEVYYFDTSTSSLKVQPLAICPVIHRQDSYDTTTRYPLFWIPYTEIEPYARQMPVMTSGINNSTRGTIDDFFRLRHYDGEIYKAESPSNLAISQYTSTPEEMKAEQDRIEQELIDFKTQLRKEETPSVTPPREVKHRSRRTATSSTDATGTTPTMRDRRY